MLTKKAYDSPKVTFYGNIEQITFGSVTGFTDGLIGNAGDPGGNFPGECEKFPNRCGS